MQTKRQLQKSIGEYYDAEASSYAEKYLSELDSKPYDRYILSRFSDGLPQTGIICETGCGPGQVSRYLEKEARIFTGLDLSVSMLRESKKSHRFDLAVNGNYFTMPFRDESLDGILAFYAIVHDETSHIEQLLCETNRVLKSNGLFLFSFHSGSERIKAANKASSIEYIFHDFEKVYNCIKTSAFSILEGVTRLPYPDAEYPSRRAYFLLKKE